MWTDYNTLLGIFNADDEESRVLVSLDYYADGAKHSYDLPELTLPGRASELVDIGHVITAGKPDKDGDVIPASVTLGGYRVHKVTGNPADSIITEALVLNRRTKSFLTFYNTAICVRNIHFHPPDGALIDGFVSEVREIRILGEDQNGFPVDLTVQGTFFSGNENVAAISGPGFVSLVAPGETSVSTSIDYLGVDQSCFECAPGAGCTYQWATSFNSVRVRPTVTISGPANVPLRGPGSSGLNSIQLTATGHPGGGTFHWRTSSTNVTLTNTISATATVTSQSESSGQTIQVKSARRSFPADPESCCPDCFRSDAFGARFGQSYSHDPHAESTFKDIVGRLL